MNPSPQTGIAPHSTCFLSMKENPLAHPVTVGGNGRAVRLGGITSSARPGFVHGKATVKGRRVNLLVPSSALVPMSPAR